MICIWWWWEAAESGLTLTGDLYRAQLNRVKKTLGKKRSENATNHKAVMFHQDTRWPDVARLRKGYLKNRGWKILPHPSYSPDLVAFPTMVLIDTEFFHRNRLSLRSGYRN